MVSLIDKPKHRQSVKVNAKSQDKQELNVLERSTRLNVKPDSLSWKCSENLSVLVTLD